MYNSKSEPPCKLWTLNTMYQCSFIDCHKWITLVGMLIMGEPAHVQGREYIGTPYFLLNFAMNLKLL